jgi:WD40 repeat protein
MDGTAKVWDVKTGDCLYTFTDHTNEVLDVTFDLCGSRIATASADGIIYVYSTRTFEQLLKLSGHTNEISRVTFDHLMLLAAWFINHVT